jgi:sirohydrochlorin cobaltochelatase
MHPKPEAALVIAGHGSTLNADSSAPTHAHADAIRERGLFATVAACFWKEEPSMREVLRMVGEPEIYLVPDFISEGYFTRTVIPREFALDGPLTLRDGRTIKYCDPVGSHERMTGVILHRAVELGPDVPPRDTSLIIVGHGTSLNDNSAAAAKRQVRRIAELGIYGEVLAAYMEEAPLICDWAECTAFPNVLVVPFFIADGLHSYQDIPVLLGIEEEGSPPAGLREVFRRNPHELRGKRLYYASAIGTDPMMADVILDQVAAFDARHGGIKSESASADRAGSPRHPAASPAA